MLLKCYWVYESLGWFLCELCMLLSKTMSTKFAAVLFLELVQCDRSKKLTELQSLMKTSFPSSFLPYCNLKWV